MSAHTTFLSMEMDGRFSSMATIEIKGDDLKFITSVS